MEDILKIFVILFIFIMVVVFYPWIAFWFAYLGGVLAKIFIGQELVAGFALLGINISIEQIPLIAGTLGWIGGFFKVISSSTSKKEN